MAFNTDNNNMINNMNCKVITTNNAGYDLAEAGEIGLLFKGRLWRPPAPCANGESGGCAGTCAIGSLLKT